MFNTVNIDDVVDVNVTALENEGNGVCKIGGMICFVPKVLPGEVARIRITERHKNFLRGKLIEIIEKSKDRCGVDCLYYGECGGCNLRHQLSKANLKFKKEKVETALRKIAKIDVKVENTIPCKKEDNYRNKASFKLEDDKIGFFEEGTYRLIDIKDCLLCENEINKVLKLVKKYINYNINEIKILTVKYSNEANELLIDIESNNNKDIKIKDYLINNISNIKTIIFNGKVVYGNGYIRHVTNNLAFNVSAKSFYQVNSMQTEKLYSEAINVAKLKKDDVVLDLYCGTGTISCILSKYVKKVIGIEIVEDAIKDAKNNLKINNIENVKFICADATKEISKIKENIDVIFLDPPRKGVDRKAIAIIKKIRPQKIIYISCNPVTMSRDIGYLSDLYDVKKVVPVDMFPNTSHVEVITRLDLK